MLVDRIERLLQALAGLAVDPANRGLQGLHGFGQILRLGVQISLALRGGRQFVQRREIDRAQGGHVLV